MIEDESNRAHRVGDGWLRTHDASTNLVGKHGEACDYITKKKEHEVGFDNIRRLNQNVLCQKHDPSKKGPWLNDMCPHEWQYNKKSNQDELALQDQFELLLVVNLGELHWLKES